MRKLKLFFVMLLACVGLTARAATAVTSLTGGKKYVLMDASNNYFNGQGTGNTTLGVSNVFTFSGTNNSFSLASYAAASTYVVVNKSGNGNNATYSYGLGTTATSFTFGYSTTDAKWYVRNKQGTNYYFLYANGTKMSASQSNVWSIYEAEVVTVNYSGVDKASETVACLVGDAITAPTISGYTVDKTSETIESGETTVTFTYTANGGTVDPDPFAPEAGRTYAIYCDRVSGYLDLTNTVTESDGYACVTLTSTPTRVSIAGSSTDGWTIQSVESPKYWAGTAKWSTFASTDTYSWAITGTNDSFVVQRTVNTGTKNHVKSTVTKSDSGDGENGLYCDGAEADADAFKLVPYYVVTYKFVDGDGNEVATSKTNYCLSGTSYPTVEIPVGYTTTTANPTGNVTADGVYSFVCTTTATYTVTYIYVDESNKEISRTTTTVGEGDAYPDITVPEGYETSESKPDGTVTESSEVTIHCTKIPVYTITYNYVSTTSGDSWVISTTKTQCEKGSAYPELVIPANYTSDATKPEGTVTANDEVTISCTLATEYFSTYATAVLAKIGTTQLMLDGDTKVTVGGDTTISALATALQSVTGDTEHAKYEALKAAVENLANYIKLDYLDDNNTGRFFIRNYTYSNGAKERGAYMMSMVNPMCTIAEGLNYWGVWDITRMADGTYRIVNEGNSKILTPTTRTENLKKDKGLLHYDSSKMCYVAVGDADTATDNPELRLAPAVWLNDEVATNFATITASPVEGNYFFCDRVGEAIYEGTTAEDKDKTGADAITKTHADRNVKCGAYTTFGDACFWEFIPVSQGVPVVDKDFNAKGITDENDTHTKTYTTLTEDLMFQRNINQLAGYVGGVVTLSDVSEIPDLAAIDTYRDAAAALIASASTDAAANASKQGVEAQTNIRTTPGADYIFNPGQSKSEGGAEMYHDVLFKIALLKSMNTGYYQDLTAGRPFFFETVCGTRPEFGYRLHEGTGYNSAAGWTINTTAPSNDDKDDATVTFYATPSEYNYTAIEDGKEVTIKGTKYVLKDGNGYYFSKSQESDLKGRAILRTKDVNQAISFVIDPVIPGVYQIRDIDNVTWARNEMLTISDEGTNYHMTHYGVSEASSLWRFKTYNTISAELAGPDSDTPATFGTFSNVLNGVYEKTSTSDQTNMSPYYVRAGRWAYAADNATVTYPQKDDAGYKSGLKEDMEATHEQLEAETTSDEDQNWGVKWTNEQHTAIDGTSINNISKFTIFLDEVPVVDGNYYLQSGEGYVFRSTKDEDTDVLVTKSTQGIEAFNGTIAAEHADYIRGNNMLKSCISGIAKIDDSNYYDIFVLSYVPTTSQVGTMSYQGHVEKVMGVGYGFYRLKRGKSLGANKAYLDSKMFYQQIEKRYGSAWTDVINAKDNTGTSTNNAPARVEGTTSVTNSIPSSCQLVFRDVKGVVTGIEEAVIIDDDSIDVEEVTTIYDLSGRRVENPVHGQVYILGGKKVLF